MTWTTHISGVTETARRKPSGREGARPMGSLHASYPAPMNESCLSENLRDRGVFAVDFASRQLAGGT